MSERPSDEDRKKLRAQYKQSERNDWESRLPLELEELEALLDHLDERFEEDGCDHTLRITEAWLGANGHDVQRVALGLREMGGACDCEVLANVDPEDQI